MFCEATFQTRRDLSRDWPMMATVPGGPRDDLFPFVPIENTMPDPLHCLLRVFDCLWARLWEDMQKEHPRNLSKAVAAVNKEFNFKLRWVEKDGKCKLPLQFNARDRLLRLQTVNVKKLFPEQRVSRNKALGDRMAWTQGRWREFASMHTEHTNAFPPTCEEKRREWLAHHKGRCAAWVRELCSIDEDRVAGGSNGRFGERKRNVRTGKGCNTATIMKCYMHLLCAHFDQVQAVVPGGMKCGSMQALERLNNQDGAQHFKCNHRRREHLLSMMMGRQRICFPTLVGAKRKRQPVIVCKECPTEKIFKTQRGLNIHRKKMHGWVSSQHFFLKKKKKKMCD